MSFSSDVKIELAKQHSKAAHCQIAELAAMIMQEGRIGINPYALSFETENEVLLEKYATLMRNAFYVDADQPISSSDCKKIIEAIQGLYLEKTCCKRAFIRGAFLSSGSLSDPEKNYHFEILFVLLG